MAARRTTSDHADQPVGELDQRVEEQLGRHPALVAARPVGAAQARAGEADGRPGQSDEGRPPPGRRRKAGGRRGGDDGDRERPGGAARLLRTRAHGGHGTGGLSSPRWALLGARDPPRRRLGPNGVPRPGRPGCRPSHEPCRSYVALTKPRIIELLLVTTLPTMVVAQRGLPRLGLDRGHPGRGHPGRRRCQRGEHVRRPGHRPAHAPDPEPPARDRGGHARRSALAFAALLEAVAFVELWGARQPALGGAGPLGHRLLRRRLHAVAEAPVVAEHRHRWGRRGGAGAGGVERCHRFAVMGAGRSSSPSSSCGRPRTSGPWPCATGRLRGGARADAPGRGHAHPDRPQRVLSTPWRWWQRRWCSPRSCTWVPPTGRRVGGRCCLPRDGRPAVGARARHAAIESHAMRLFGYSITLPGGALRGDGRRRLRPSHPLSR